MLIGGALFVGLIAAPIDVSPVRADLPGESSARRAKPSPTAPIKLEDFGSTLKKPLQRPLQDPKPPAAAVVKPQPPPPPPKLNVVLVGTAVETEANRSKAWLQPAGKQIQMVAVGQVLTDMPGKPEVKSIQERRIVLSVNGQDVPVEIKEDG